MEAAAGEAASTAAEAEAASSRWTTHPLGAAHGGGGSSFGPKGTSFRGGVWGNLGDGRLTIRYDPAGDACAESATHGRRG